MGDEKFLKYLICAKRGWNLNSDEVQRISDFEWMMHFYFESMITHDRWTGELEPQAELVGMITNPEVYNNYVKFKNAKENKRGEKVVATKNGIHTQTEAHAFFDARKGIVDNEGKVLIPLDVLKRNNPEFNDFAVSL